MDACAVNHWATAETTRPNIGLSSSTDLIQSTPLTLLWVPVSSYVKRKGIISQAVFQVTSALWDRKRVP